MHKHALILVVSVLLMGLGAFHIIANRIGSESTSVPLKTTASGTDAAAHLSSAPNPPTRNINITIYYDEYGFDPNILTLPIGTNVTVDNISTRQLEFNSVPEQAQQNSALNLGLIASGATKRFQIAKSGIWQFEGNNDPETRGVISTGSKLSVKPQMLPDARISSNKLDIVYDDYGFMPNEISVPVGTIITLTNASTKTQPGPTLFKQGAGMGGINPELNIGVLEKRQSKSFVVTNAGSWLLQNAYQPHQKAFVRINVY